MYTLPLHLSEAPDPLPSHLPEFLRLFDEATLWMAEKGITGQWGPRAPSQNAQMVERILHSLEKSRERNVTTIFARTTSTSPLLGIIAFSDCDIPGGQSTIPPAGEAEVYIQLLLTTRDPAHRGLGKRLLREAVDEARRRGVGLIRLFAYAGEGAMLVGMYERFGFRKKPEGMIVVTGWDGVTEWPGQLMELRLEEEEGEGL